jgi:putative aldouronate transport system permease protein
MRMLRKTLRKYWQLYIFLLLPLIYLLIFKYYPMLGAQIAFRKFRTSLGIWNSPWVGFANFEKFFTSYQFERVIGNTIKLAVYQIVANFPFPILFALLLNTMHGAHRKKLVQTVVYSC